MIYSLLLSWLRKLQPFGISDRKEAILHWLSFSMRCYTSNTTDLLNVSFEMRGVSLVESDNNGLWVTISHISKSNNCHLQLALWTTLSLFFSLRLHSDLLSLPFCFSSLQQITRNNPQVSLSPYCCITMGFWWHLWTCHYCVMCVASTLSEHVMRELLHWLIYMLSVGSTTIPYRKIPIKFTALVCDWDDGHFDAPALSLRYIKLLKWIYQTINRVKRLQGTIIWVVVRGEKVTETGWREQADIQTSCRLSVHL